MDSKGSLKENKYCTYDVVQRLLYPDGRIRTFPICLGREVALSWKSRCSIMLDSEVVKHRTDCWPDCNVMY
jgi:hypothetical protein